MYDPLREAPLPDKAAWGQWPLSELVAMQQRLEAALKSLKARQAMLADVLALRLMAPTQAALQQQAKDTGTVHFVQGHYRVTADVPKRVVWDQALLAEVIEQLPPDVRKQAIKTRLTINERDYAAWPATLKQLVHDARTVQTGTITFRFQPMTSTEAAETTNTDTQHSPLNRHNEEQHP